MLKIKNRLNTRYFKVFRDITSDLPKNSLLMLSIAIGVLGIGTILGAYSVLTREMGGNYMGTNPAMATIQIKNDTIGSKLLEDIKKLPNVSDAERRATVLGRMKVDKDWFPVLLFVVEDFRNSRINTFRYERGDSIPQIMSALVERTVLKVIKTDVGGKILVKAPSGSEKSLKISGIVHDAGLAPAWQEQEGYFYITMETLKSLGDFRGFDEIRINFDNKSLTINEIETKVNNVAKFLGTKGISVQEIRIPPPGKHPHQGQMYGVLTLFIVFSFLILVLGSILVTTSISTLMLRQIRQIGVMKTIGASSSQVMSLYLILIIILSVISVIIAIPLSMPMAQEMIRQIAKLLNLEIFDNSIPSWVAEIQILSGIGIPILAAIFPIGKGSGKSVKNALDSYGLSETNFTINRILSLLFRFKIGSDLFILALRNIFRQKARLIMALILLSFGGAMFMTSLNISRAWEINIRSLLTNRLDDLEIQFENPVPESKLIDSVYKINGVKLIETWKYSPTSYIKDVPYDVVRTYPDKGHGSFVMLAPPKPSKLINFSVIKGRWFDESSIDELVLNQHACAQLPFVKIGDSVVMSVFGKPCKLKVVGFIQDVGSPSGAAYVSQETFSRVSQMNGKTNLLRIAMMNRNVKSVLAISQKIDNFLIHENVPVRMGIPMALRGNAYAEHISVLVSTLLITSLLMGLIGIFSLMSTMSMNIFDRTKELGVMKAIGASRKIINKMVIFEGFIISFISLIGAFGLSLILSGYIGDYIGQMSFRTSLSLEISITGILIWIAIVILGTIIATLLPATRANNITIREALSYE